MVCAKSCAQNKFHAKKSRAKQIVRLTKLHAENIARSNSFALDSCARENPRAAEVAPPNDAQNKLRVKHFGAGKVARKERCARFNRWLQKLVSFGGEKRQRHGGPASFTRCMVCGAVRAAPGSANHKRLRACADSALL